MGLQILCNSERGVEKGRGVGVGGGGLHYIYLFVNKYRNRYALLGL